MRIPWASFVLVFTVLAVYFFSSGGLWYPDSVVVSQHAYGVSNPLAFLYSLFFHIGAHHLVGNVVPLLVFSLLLEWSLSSRHVLFVFLAAGLCSAFVFSILNPSSLLVGASAGISGLVTAGALLKPKWGLGCLLLMPLLLTFVAFPIVDWAVSASFSNLDRNVTALSQHAEQLQHSGQSQQAAVERQQAESANHTLIQQEMQKTQEAQSQSDPTVHVVGALVGVLYVFAFFRSKMREGFSDLFDSSGRFFSHFGKRMV